MRSPVSLRRILGYLRALRTRSSAEAHTKAVLFSFQTLEQVISIRRIQQLYYCGSIPSSLNCEGFAKTNVPLSLLQEASGMEALSPDSCAAVVEIPPRIPLSDIIQRKRVLILDNVRDPGNVGTILRTCAAFDWSAILSVGCSDPFNDKVIRASTGSSFSVHWANNATVEQIVDAIHGCSETKGGASLTCLTSPSSTRDIREISTEGFQGRVRLIVGSEAKGISASWGSLENTKAVRVESVRIGRGVLNVGVAASIAMHHLQ